MSMRASPKSIYVTVVADNAETIDGLHSYLSGAGVASHAIRTLYQASAVPLAATAIVIFPDELRVADIVTSITALRAARPHLLILLVTSAPHRFRAAVAPDGRSSPPIVLPKPAFGWTILDAIRAHAPPELP